MTHMIGKETVGPFTIRPPLEPCCPGDSTCPSGESIVTTVNGKPVSDTPIDPCTEARNAALAKLTKALEGLEADTDQIVRIAEAIAKLLPVTP